MTELQIPNQIVQKIVAIVAFDWRPNQKQIFLTLCFVFAAVLEYVALNIMVRQRANASFKVNVGGKCVGGD